MPTISLSPIVKQINKSTAQLTKAQSRVTSAVEKRSLKAKIKKLKHAKMLVEEACGHAGLSVKVPTR